MDAGEIRSPAGIEHRLELRVATVLPPREGFSPQAVGAIGLLVHRLGAPGDLVIGEASRTLAFSGRHFQPAAAVFWPPVGRSGRYAAGVLRVVRREAPDLIEVHNRPSLARLLARKQRRAKIVLFLHNDPQAMRDARTPEERAWLLRSVAVVCVSEHLRRRFMEGVRAATPTPTVLPNAIDLAELPSGLPADRREKTILFAGRVVADKGADAFVRACAGILPALPGWRAVMIGADRFWANAVVTPFERMLAPQAQEAGIVRAGYLPHEEVLAAMSRAAIVVVPSRWEEPFGMAALEAMACGAALVCSPRGGLPELAGDAACTADPDTPGALERALLDLCRDPEGRARLAEAGRARAARFDAPAARARLAALRREVLHSG